jgi:hypothetical protein
MSAIRDEYDILDTDGEKILTKRWNGQYIELVPSYTHKNGDTIYRIDDEASDICLMRNQQWKERRCEKATCY